MPFAWIALAFAVGILTADLVELPGWLGWFTSGVALLLAAMSLLAEEKGWRAGCFIRRLPGTRLPISFLPLLFFLGFSLYLSNHPVVNASTLQYYEDCGCQVGIEGTIVEPPETSGNLTRVVLQAESFTVGGDRHPDHSRILITLSARNDLHYGDELSVTGTPAATAKKLADDSFSRSLAARRIFTRLASPQVEKVTPVDGFSISGWLYKLRDRSMDLIKAMFPAPESGLMAGILLGPRGEIPPDVYQTFQETGTSHIIAISGFNMAILAGLISGLCVRLLGKWRGAGVAIVTLVLYSVLVGGSASVIRAAIMASLGILAGLLGRKQAGVNTLFLAAFVMLGFNPFILWDVGFQLSFTATLGLIWFAAPFQSGFKVIAGRWLPAAWLEKTAALVGEYFLFTLAAQLTTFPLLLLYFHRLPVVALLANPLVLPAQPPLMVLGGLAVILGHVWLPVGKVFSLAALPFASYTLRINGWLAGLHLPGVWLPQVTTVAMVVYYGLLIALVYWKPLQERIKSQILPLAGLGLAALAAFGACQALADRPDGRLHIYLADGSASGAVLVRSPSGRYVLAGTGQDGLSLLEFTGQRLPRLESVLDAVILDDRDAAGIRALTTALPQLRPAAIYLTGEAGNDAAQGDLRSTAREFGLEPLSIYGGDVLNLGDDANMMVEDTEEGKGPIRIEWRGFTMQLYPPEGKCEGGSALVVVSDQSWACPANPPALAILLDEGEPPVDGWVDLAAHGWIHIQTDGSQVWAESEH